MASAYWRTNYTVESMLQEREVGWEFFQLVKLLLLMENGEPLKNEEAVLALLSDNIKFKASLAADFPPNDIRQVERNSEDKTVDITLANGALTTKDGPLPEPFVAWVRELSGHGDHAMADFIDIFNNRLMALRYLIGRATRPNLVDTAAENSETGSLLHALSGAVYNRSPQRSDLRLAGLLSNNRMSYPVVKQLMLFSMGLNLKALNCYQGGWLTVDDQDHSRLGDSEMCQLGKTTTLGTKIWDQQKAIELVIGSVSWNKVKALIPGGKQHEEFVELLRRITDCRCDCNIVLLIAKNQVPPLAFGHNADDKSVFTLLDEESQQQLAATQAAKLTERPAEKLSLGLTTVLPTAVKRQQQGEKELKVRFTVETSGAVKVCA